MKLPKAPGTPSLLHLTILVAGLVSATRILVAGAYVSLWDFLWYSKPFPSVLGILFFIAAAIVGPLRLPRLLPTALLTLYALAGAATDDIHLLYLAAAPVAGLLLYTLQWAAAARPEAIPLGVGLDLALRVAAGGLEPWDHPLTSIVYAGILAYAGIELAFTRPYTTPSPAAYAWLAAAELGAAYPNAALHYAGIHDYGPLGYTLTAALIALGYSLGVLLPKTLGPALAGLAAIMALAGFTPGPLWAFTLAAATTTALRGSPPGNALAVRIGPVLFVALMVAGVAVYAYPYLGLWPLADKMEALIALVALATIPLALKGQPTTAKPRSLTPLAPLLMIAFIALALQAGQPLNQPPTTVVTLNLHQGYTWDGRLNGWEATQYLAQHPGLAACLQEVDAGRLTSAYTDQVLALRLKGLHIAYQPAIEGTYGVAVATSQPITQAQGILLPSTGEQRAAVKAQTPSLTLVSAHLGLDPQERLTQAQHLLQHALTPPQAQLLCGDLNEQEGPAIALIQQYYTLIPPPGQPTCCLGEALNQTIDYIGYNPDTTRITGYTIQHVDISDHLPVIARLQPQQQDS